MAEKKTDSPVAEEPAVQVTKPADAADAVQPGGAAGSAGEVPPQEQPAGAGAAPQPQDNKNAMHRFYDKLPITYKQADLIVKVLVAAFIVVLVVAVVTGGLFKG